MKKVLIVTYYWPPSGGPGVQRVLKFAKYLPKFDWEPIILTVKNGAFPAIDKTLIEEVSSVDNVYRTNLFEPNNLYKKFIGLDNDAKIPVAVLAEDNTNWKKDIANWIRMNFFIPDAKIGWLPFALNKGRKIIKYHKPDIIFSSSPPPSVHVIAKFLSNIDNTKWIADFRDPWTDIHYYEHHSRNLISEKIDSNLEKNVLEKADKITCISQKDIEMDFGQKISKSKCINIPNGYDEADFPSTSKSYIDDSKFKIMHLGAIYKERLPTNLFKSIQILDQNNKISTDTFILELVGNVENSVKTSIEKFNISEYVNFISYMPHREAIEKSMEASLLLLLINQTDKNIRILPGKTFEYLRVGSPILALGPENGEVARIIRETEAGTISHYNDCDKIKNSVLKYYKEWQNNQIGKDDPQNIIKKYSRKNLTKKLVGLFEDLQ